MKISLVTCSYNHARYLDATIRSVLDQRYDGLEYLVVDGGSDDGSADIIRSHGASFAYWVSEPDAGQTHALIKGFERATGDVCGWLCSDDLLLPGALDRVAQFFERNPDVQAVYGDALWIDVDGAVIRPKREMGFNRFVFLHDHNYVPQPSMFWRRGLYESVGGLSTEFSLAMDNDLWERFSSQVRIAHIPYYLSCMRYYPEQKTRSSQWRARGFQEGTRVRHRATILGRSKALRPALWFAARAMRVALKGAAGGYMAAIPEDVRPWLEQHATPA